MDAKFEAQKQQIQIAASKGGAKSVVSLLEIQEQQKLRDLNYGDFNC